MMGLSLGVEDTCPRLNSTERTYVGDLEAAEPFRNEAGMALEAVLALEAVVDAFQRWGSTAVEDLAALYRS